MRFFRRRRRRTLSPEEAAAAETVVTPRYSSYALRHLRLQAVQQARRARREALVLLLLLAAVLFTYSLRDEIPGSNTPIRIGAFIAVLLLGWVLARDIGRAMGPALLHRLEPATAGTVGFLIRLVAVAVTVLVALRIAGIDPATLAVGGALTAVVLGLAAQQTLANVLAGTVLIGARPFRIGDRIRLQGGGLAGVVEGQVRSLGLLHTTLANGADSILVPNSVVLSVAIVPLREPASIDLRARLQPGVRPTEVQALLDRLVTVPTRDRPHIGLEELDDEEIVVRIAATPVDEADGPALADEILEALQDFTRPGAGPSPDGEGTRAGAPSRFGAEDGD